MSGMTNNGSLVNVPDFGSDTDTGTAVFDTGRSDNIAGLATMPGPQSAAG